MKKNYKSLFAAVAAFAVVLSCAKEELPDNTPVTNPEEEVAPEVSEPLGEITVSATLPDDMTKVAFDPTVEGGKPIGLALTWEEGDQLCVYDAANKTNKATLALAPESAGQKAGKFTGNVDFSASSYYVEVLTKGEVADYATQTQPADGQATALKYRAYANTDDLTNELVLVNFTTPLAITAKLPSTEVVATVESVTITASEAIFNGGKTLTVNLGQKGDAGEDGILHLYVNLPEENPAIAEGTSLLVKFNTPSKTDHTVYTRYVELGAAEFEAGKLNTININASESDVHAGAKGCTGAEGNAYLVGDKYQMQAVNALLKADELKYVELVDDIDLKDVVWTSNTVNVNLNGNNHTISNYTSANGFFENLTGNVQNLKFDGAVLNVTNIAGLLADVAENVSVKNVTITRSSVSSTKGLVGGLFGQLNSGTIEDVNVACTIKGTQQLGGIVGLMNSGSLTNCHSIGAVTGSQYYLGGFVGAMNSGTISGCSASGDVSATDASTNYVRTGGFVGQINGSQGNVLIENCNATGDVNVYGRLVGGFVGYANASENNSVEISNCVATGDVTTAYSAETKAGGFIGEFVSGVIKNSRAEGAVTATGYTAGGFAGYMSATSLSGCTATGSVSGTNNIGGLLGYGKNNITISGCHSTVTVSATGQFVGGLVGYCENATVNTSDYSGTVTTSSNLAGGFIGKMNIGTVDQCYAKGSVTVTGGHYVGGLIGQTTGDVTITKSYTETTVGDNQKNHRGGLVGNINSGKLTASNCYTTGSINAASYSGGFIGGVESAASIEVTNSFTNCSVAGAKWNVCVFAGSINDNCTTTGFIGWNTSNRVAWAYSKEVPAGNYMGKDGTISAKAKEFGWDETIWDLSKDVPTLKCFAK